MCARTFKKVFSILAQSINAWTEKDNGPDVRTCLNIYMVEEIEIKVQRKTKYEEK